VKHAEAAQLRATISSILSAQPGQILSTDEVASAIGQGARTTGQILGGMARGKLIEGPIKQKGVRGKCWRWPTAAVAEAPPTTGHPSGVRPRRATTTTAKEIELEIGGISVVVGRNPATGRLRIILEEV